MGKKKSSIGCLFWIALILLVLVIFLFNRKTIENVLETTGFLDLISRDKEAPAEVVEEPSAPEPEKRPVEQPPVTRPDPPVEEPEKQPLIVIETEPAEDPVSRPIERVEADEPESDKKLRKARLFYISVDDEGTISLQGIMRPVYYTDSPLTDTLNTLLKGLSPSELSKGLITLIPEGTVLKGVIIRNGVAYVDFNEKFRFNAFGRDGYLAQLKQVVYTSTEFATVGSVQILINGERHTYLGPEGVFIGDPLSRDAFN